MQSNQAVSIAFFLLFLCVTVGITAWASRRNRSAGQYLVASGGIKAWQNGLAMSGEYMSASAMLGMTGLLATMGFSSYVYPVAAVVTWPLILLLLADPIRRLGQFTLTDVIAWRLKQKPIRLAAVLVSIPMTLLYLVAQLVAGGILIKVLFGIPYSASVIFVGLLTMSYVLFGGMLATTWVQIIKAILQHLTVCVLTMLVLSHFDYSPFELFRRLGETEQAHMLVPRDMDPVGRWEMISLAIALVCGAIGMPQILTRFFTVPDPMSAKKSAVYATMIVGSFHLMVLVVGFGALALLGREAILGAGASGNMAVPMLAKYVGGDTFFGIVCGVAFATVIAVVAGLTLTSATTFAHDLWSRVVHAGKQGGEASLSVARIGAVIVASIATLLALMFESINVAFLIGLSQAIIAATNFPLLMLTLFWSRLTTAGAVSGMVVGCVSSMLLIFVSPAVQVALMKLDRSVLDGVWWFYPLNSPAIVCVPLAFVVMILVSLLKREPSSENKFSEMQGLLMEHEGKTFAVNH
ncbi:MULTISPECIES: cation acetate symporter [Pseudomonas]|uniref:Cation acetate symporter n=1 Tax=Pseudomonas putida TaxID=303 RepID=A0A2S3XCZ3_PSEPU|nr:MULTISPECIES: cation acetate symporter [Pseudomonas]AVD83827.1 cation/acetate symporter ActP [Pseudomonas sp. SWI6]AVD95004.1 cation/acetate symporter ActP [Pseudomonas sp. SWI36]ELU0814757.1 cation acetate symporter [Pseudomonas putida]MBH3388228.1 cation acetate symporter [Pseudomonas putida]MCK2121432.1 cation acetate symporter [Pseudomonas sp. PNPG3]